MVARSRGIAVALGTIVVVAVAVAVAALAIAPAPARAQPVVTIVCDADSDCGGVDEACVFDRCVQIRCSTDIECTNRLPRCDGGICKDFESCDGDGDCGAGEGCVQGSCRDVDCRTDGDCPGGRSCVAHQCRDCVTNAQCGANGVCRENDCVCVECTRPGQCAFDQTCSAENRCVPRCGAGQVFVSTSDGNRICTACVNPDTRQRCNRFPGCRGNTICAQGFCIQRCNLEPPDFDSLLDDFRDLRYQPDPDGLPDCPGCVAIFELAGVRSALERAGIDQPVALRLLGAAGEPLADLGAYAPNRGSWAAVPLRAQPKLAAPPGKAGGCDYALEIRGTAAGTKAARAPICLRPLSR